jgi:hypothetical protein
MKNYVKNLRSGVINKINARTLNEAKKEAMKQASYDGGSLELVYNGDLYYSDLETSPEGNFQWSNWEQL